MRDPPDRFRPMDRARRGSRQSSAVPHAPLLAPRLVHDSGRPAAGRASVDAAPRRQTGMRPTPQTSPCIANDSRSWTGNATAELIEARADTVALREDLERGLLADVGRPGSHRTTRRSRSVVLDGDLRSRSWCRSVVWGSISGSARRTELESRPVIVRGDDFRQRADTLGGGDGRLTRGKTRRRPEQTLKGGCCWAARRWCSNAFDAAISSRSSVLTRFWATIRHS